jgi:hypothetical protein
MAGHVSFTYLKRLITHEQKLQCFETRVSYVTPEA